MPKAGSYKGIPKYRKPPIDPYTGTMLITGNGCKKHPDCFSCPLPDCRMPSKERGYISPKRVE